MKRSLLTLPFLIASMVVFSNPFSIQLNIKDCACGANNGEITIVSVAGGAPPYAYNWSNGSTMTHITNLLPGTYKLYVTDGAGQVDSVTAIVNNDNFISGASLSYFPQPGPGYGISHPCGSQCNGIVYLIQDGMTGTPPFYLFSSNPSHITGSVYPPTGAPIIEGVCATDMYITTVYDANGCSGNAISTSPYQPSSFAVNYTVAPSCNGMNNGNISFDFFESYNFPYNLGWSGPSGTGTTVQFLQNTEINNLLPGNYSITVTMSLSVSPCDSTFIVNVPDLGTNCGVVSGEVYLDSVRNCVADLNETVIPGRIVKITPGPYYGTSDSTGNYKVNLPYGNYNVQLISPANFSRYAVISMLH